MGLDLELAQNNPNVDFDVQNRIGVNFQTNISEKVIVNGKVGVPFGTASQTTITGDVRIDWVLNADGSLRATVFNRENRIRNFGEEIGFTQGVGLSYNVEFDTFKELMQLIFKGKKDKEDSIEVIETEKTTEDSTLPEFISMKKKGGNKEQ